MLADPPAPTQVAADPGPAGRVPAHSPAPPRVALDPAPAARVPAHSSAPPRVPVELHAAPWAPAHSPALTRVAVEPAPAVRAPVDPAPGAAHAPGPDRARVAACRSRIGRPALQRARPRAPRAGSRRTPDARPD